MSKPHAVLLYFPWLWLLTGCAGKLGPEFGLPPIPKENARRFELHYSIARGERFELKARGSRLDSTLTFEVTISNEGSDPVYVCRSCTQLFIDEVESDSGFALRSKNGKRSEVGPEQETVTVSERSTLMLTLVFKRTSVEELDQEGVARLHIGVTDSSDHKQGFDFRFRLIPVKGNTAIVY